MHGWNDFAKVLPRQNFALYGMAVPVLHLVMIGLACGPLEVRPRLVREYQNFFQESWSSVDGYASMSQN